MCQEANGRSYNRVDNQIHNIIKTETKLYQSDKYDTVMIMFSVIGLND